MQTKVYAIGKASHSEKTVPKPFFMGEFESPSDLEIYLRENIKIEIIKSSLGDTITPIIDNVVSNIIENVRSEIDNTGKVKAIFLNRLAITGQSQKNDGSDRTIIHVVSQIADIKDIVDALESIDDKHLDDELRVVLAGTIVNNTYPAMRLPGETLRASLEAFKLLDEQLGIVPLIIVGNHAYVVTHFASDKSGYLFIGQYYSTMNG